MSIYIANGTDFLMHYGVKGMKWGVRQQKRYDKLMEKHKYYNSLAKQYNTPAYRNVATLHKYVSTNSTPLDAALREMNPYRFKAKANRALYKAKKMKGTATDEDRYKGSLWFGESRAERELLTGKSGYRPKQKRQVHGLHEGKVKNAVYRTKDGDEFTVYGHSDDWTKRKGKKYRDLKRVK